MGFGDCGEDIVVGLESCFRFAWCGNLSLDLPDRCLLLEVGFGHVLGSFGFGCLLCVCVLVDGL